MTEDKDPFASCPECSNCDGPFNVGSFHWFVCHAHRVRWPLGWNVLSGWRDETEEQQRAKWARVADYGDLSKKRTRKKPARKYRPTEEEEIPF